MHPAIKSITFHPGVEHDAVIDWPNGLGETPCSTAYRQLLDERNAIYDPNDDAGRNLDDLSPEDYQRWNLLDDRLLGMQAEGHIGKSIRY